MDQTTKKVLRRTCLIAVVTGGIGFVLRLLLYRIGADEKNMLVSWHPLTVGLALTALAIVAGAALNALELPKNSKCPGPVGRLAAAGSLVMGLSLVAFLFLCVKNHLSLLVIGAGALSAVAMIAAAVAQYRGRQPYFLLYTVVCLFMAGYLINRYRTWSQNPQLMDYVLTLVGMVIMMLYAFQLAQGSLGQATRRSFLMLSGVGAFLCLAGASGGEAVPLCLDGAAWMITGLLSSPEESL